MLKRIALFVLLPSLAFAQSAPTPSPELQACQSKLLETITRELDIRAQLFATQQRAHQLETPKDEKK